MAGYVVCFVESRHKKSIAAELNKKETSHSSFHTISLFSWHRCRRYNTSSPYQHIVETGDNGTSSTQSLLECISDHQESCTDPSLDTVVASDSSNALHTV